MSYDTFSETRLNEWWTRFRDLCRGCGAEAITYDLNNFDVQVSVTGCYFNLSVEARHWFEGLMITSRDRKRELAVERENYRECEHLLSGPHDYETDYCNREASWEVTVNHYKSAYYCERHLCDACETTLQPVAVRRWPQV